MDRGYFQLAAVSGPEFKIIKREAPWIKALVVDLDFEHQVDNIPEELLNGFRRTAMILTIARQDQSF